MSNIRNNGDDGDRLAVMEVTIELIVHLGSGTFEVIESPLPDDVEIVWHESDLKHETCVILLRSKAFGLVAPGSVVPHVMPPTIQKLDMVSLVIPSMGHGGGSSHGGHGE